MKLIVLSPVQSRIIIDPKGVIKKQYLWIVKRISENMWALKLKSLKLFLFCHLDAVLENHDGDLFRHFQYGKLQIGSMQSLFGLEGEKNQNSSPIF